MAVFQVPVWFTVEADNASQALNQVKESLIFSSEDTDEESAQILSTFVISDHKDVIEVDG